MTSGETALLISGISLAISAAGFIWNIMEKFIYVKPGIQVTFGVYTIVATDMPKKRLLSVGVTNMGPGPVILHSCIAKIREPWSLRPQLAMLNPIHGDPSSDEPRSLGPFSGGLPLKLEAGEVKSFYFPFSKDTFLSEQVVRVGVNDTYSRNSWCRRKDVRKAKKKFTEAF